MIRRTVHIAVMIILLAGLLTHVAPVHAQPRLVDSTPPAGSVIDYSPTQITLTFDRVLRENGTWVTVVNNIGEQFHLSTGRIDPQHRFNLVVEVAPMPEGSYRVEYNAAGLGDTTISTGSFDFNIDLPEPALDLLTPLDAQAFQQGDIPIEMQTRFFDFNRFNNRIHLYVDGEKIKELREHQYTVEDLSPGVHEIRVVLARFDNEELPNTSHTVYIAITQPDDEITGREAAAQASPDPGLQFTPDQWAFVVVSALLLLIAGVVIGYLTRSSPAN